MILALDIGSSSARATLYDDAGAAVEGGSRQVEYHARVTADGGVEHDAQHLLEAAAACIDAVLPAARDVAAVGISTFWHGLLGFDGAGRPATPLYMYSDTRSAGEAEALGRRLDEAAVRARTGCPLHTSYWPAKLRWLAAGPSTVRPARWGSIGELLAAEWLGRGRHQHLDGLGDRPLRSGAPGLGSRDARRGRASTSGGSSRSRTSIRA